MKKKKKRGVDHAWTFVKYKIDSAIYARCRCGFSYPCYKNADDTMKIIPDPDKLYNFCLHCGARKNRYLNKVEHIDKNPPWMGLVF